MVHQMIAACQRLYMQDGLRLASFHQNFDEGRPKFMKVQSQNLYVCDRAMQVELAAIFRQFGAWTHAGQHLTMKHEQVVERGGQVEEDDNVYRINP